MTKHKHADLIHAWADGAEIQYKGGQVWYDAPNPTWCDDIQYRIKPEEKKPVVRWLWALKGKSIWTVSQMFYSEEEAKEFKEAIKLEWSRTEFPE